MTRRRLIDEAFERLGVDDPHPVALAIAAWCAAMLLVVAVGLAAMAYLRGLA